MIFGKHGSPRTLRAVLLGVAILTVAGAQARTPEPKKGPGQDDSANRTPAPDLTLQPENVRKANALADFVEGVRLEENAEMENALAAYQRVLNFDPGLSELALRVAALLSRAGDYPRAIDVLKDAIKARPKEAGPYLQLAFIYAKYLRKTEQAVKYANEAIALDPQNFEAYQRLYEIEAASGAPQKALLALDRAANVKSDEPSFWIRLGKLYAAIVFKSEGEPKPEALKRVNSFFDKAVAKAGDDAVALKEVADYYAASQQIQEAIPLYLKVLELQPDDVNAREKLATGFVLTHQREKAIAMLEEVIRKQPAKYQPYELLAQMFDDGARALERANQSEQAKVQFAKAASNYEQSLLLNPARANTYLRLAELLIIPLRDSERAARILTEARQRFPGVPEFSYFLAIAQRESKRPQQAIGTFEEALNEAQLSHDEVLNARFYFDYGVAADQAGLYDKAADLFRKSISLDPGNSAEAYNYVAYMWADHNMHLDEAEQMAGEALQFDPNNGAYLDTLGWIHYRKGKFEEALNLLLRAEQNLTKPDATVLEHIGDAHAKLDRIPQALEFWQKAIALTPDNKLLADKIEKTRTMMSQGTPEKIKRID
jgi:tetratricopeptide (TPR) repeat protein